MCVTEDELGGSAGGSGAGGSIPEVVAYAPRVGLNIDVMQMIEWDEVARMSGIGAIGGALGGWVGAGFGAAVGGAAEVESQTDIEELFELKNDMLIIKGYPSPYLPMY